MDLTDRVGYLERRLGAVETELGRARQRLAAAPSWYRPGVLPPGLGATERTAFRDLERRRLAAADLRLDIDRLRDLLDDARSDPRRQKRCYLRALEWVNGARTWRDLARDFVVDPALGRPGRPFPSIPRRPAPTIEDPRRLQKVFQAILDHRDAQPGGRLRRLEDLLELRSVTEELLRSIVYTGCTLLPVEEEPAPTPIVPVLQPLRLETRFDAPAAAGESWRMRLRIVPDDIIFDRFDPLASEEELALVERLWRATSGNLDSPDGRAAWAEFVSRIGGARASWLIRTFPMVAGEDGEPAIARPAQTRTEPYFGTPRGIPPRLEVWLGRGGGAPALVTTLTVDLAAVGRLDLPDLRAGERRWWTSYAEAERVGLATSIDLGAQADDIDVVAVVGLSEETSTEWLLHHLDHGGAGLIPPGIPTNTVEGAPAAPLDGDADHWLRVARGQGASAPGARALALALTGNAANARPLLGGATDVAEVARALVQGLWHPLWGHAFKDLLGLGAATHVGGLWAAEALRPEGPLATLRIGTQPYGVLPVTPLDRWQAGPNDPPFEAAALDCLRAARDLWAGVAEVAGNVVGADTERLLDLLGHSPTSDYYAWRVLFPLELHFLLWWLLGASPSWSEFEAAYEDWLRPALDTCGELDPQVRLAAFGWPVDLDLPLVLPDNLSEEQFRELLKTLADPQFNVWAIFVEGGWQLLTDGVVPNSLLVRLLVYAHWVAAAEIAREQNGITGPVPPQLCWSEREGERLERDAARMRRPSGGPAEALRELLDEACLLLAELPVEDIERALRAVLDTASHRVDPWLTGYALRRLEDEGAAWSRQLGVYGWVDAPRPGQPGPTAAGLLHAPSQAQSYTAMILRDRAVSHPEAGRWDMDLDSASVRMANWIGEGVRAGGHLAEVLGAEVERVVVDPDQIDGLRDRFPIRAEHAGRRVCDGVAVLAADPTDLGLPAATLDGLADLRAALDAYGDLLVAQAVHHVVSGRGDIAGAAMDAAAGLAQPPTLEVLHTPRTGRTVATTALLCLPDAPDPVPGLDTSPACVADPTFAAWLTTATGDGASAAWTWEADTEVAGLITLTLADLSLAPCDAAVLPSGVMAALVATAFGPGATVRESSAGFATHARSRALLGVAGTEPAEPKHLVTNARPSGESVAEDLRVRLSVLETLAIQVRDAIAAAVTGTSADQAVALHRALRWGITAIDAAEVDVPERLLGAVAALDDRLRALPPPADRAGMSAADLARALAELAAADGRWPVLGRVDVASLATGLAPDTRPAGGGTNPVDESWLAVVATVRPGLARIESVQLEGLLADGSAPLHAWTNRPGDVWQQAGVPDPDTGRMPDSHLVVAYGPAGVLDGIDAAAPVRAFGLIDAFSEIVPEVEHTTTAAFGFNAPGARPPQALLLGVPPSPDGVLADGDLAAMVLEARRLARVRMARSTELGHLAPVLPTMAFPAAQPAGADLRRSEP